ncbi:hypothetical protein OESDEN_10174 [Oesophagostomum dentatum]|uniref:Uncharacterized protein n=1 Tax=Oesophagostomum dentatum TaxID=61180 RepID=A0A0B1T2G9_OESDE|nr:hypothetical protein OESDEN_10174 [Oesophagostomum dentatum]
MESVKLFHPKTSALTSRARKLSRKFWNVVCEL